MFTLFRGSTNKYEGRLDQTPTIEFFRNWGLMGNKYTQILHSMHSYYRDSKTLNNQAYSEKVKTWR